MGLRNLADDNDEIRAISDDNDEFREIDQFGIHRGYPYTYPFYYEGEAVPRDLSDPEA